MVSLLTESVSFSAMKPLGLVEGLRIRSVWVNVQSNIFVAAGYGLGLSSVSATNLV